MDFYLCGKLLPLTPLLFKGLLYVCAYVCVCVCVYVNHICVYILPLNTHMFNHSLMGLVSQQKYCLMVGFFFPPDCFFLFYNQADNFVLI